MNKLVIIPICLGCVFAAGTSQAIDLKQSKLTQVVNEVQIISAAAQRQKAAVVNDIFSMPDILRTGTASRAELVAADETVTRVGANTIFSFDPANRTIDLKQGSLLFHAPHGKGGGTIHTGSATASVLGTTLIVTTTPNGGFKVLDLEGEVEVKFLNGLKQKLDPGQMTFILPGGNQLAPVIIFRLDELTQNSLLVKGFNDSLDSLPLIKNQVEKQIKLIQSGKVSDTGLYAGDDASPNQVEVLDVNTLPHNQPKQETPPPPVVAPNPPPVTPTLGAAEAADAIINQSSLVDASIPTPPYHVFTSPAFPLTGNGFFTSQTFAGFVARNIFVNTPAANLNPLIVNLSPFRGLNAFDIVAVSDFSIQGPVTFNGLSAQADLALIAGNQFNLTPGIALRADTHDFLLSSPASLSLDNVSLYNLANNLSLNSGADVSLQNGSLLYAQNKLTLNAANNISAAGCQITADSSVLTSLNGGIAFDNTTLDAYSHAIFIAPTAINLNNSTLNSGYVVLNGTSSASIAINNTTINAPTAITAFCGGDLNVTGSTLNSDPASGVVTLASASGSTTISGTTINANNLSVSAGNNLNFDGGLAPAPIGAGNPPGSARYLTLNSGDGILLTARGRALTASGSNPTASFTAGFAPGNAINVNNTDFSLFAVVNMAANTIVLVNDIFSTSGIYNFGTHTGQVVINGQNPGGLAIINSYLGSSPVTIADVSLNSGPVNSPGLHSYPNGH